MEEWEEERLAFAEELEEVALQLATLDFDQSIEDQLETVSDEHERLAMTADIFMMPDMQAVVSWVQRALVHPDATDLLMGGQLFSWLEIAALIYREPDELSHLPLLIEALTDDAWPEPLDQDVLQNFLLSLRPEPLEVVDNTDDVEVENDTVVERPPLSWSEDIHPELLKAYLDETPHHISETARLVRAIAMGQQDAETRRNAARFAHTVKGSSGVVGIEPIASFTHKLEDLLDLPFKQLPDGLPAMLEAAADCLESMFDQCLGDGQLPEEYADLESELTQWVERLAALTEQEDEEEELPELNQLPDFINSDGQEAASIETPQPIVNQAHLSESSIEQLLNLTGELITSTNQISEWVNQSMELSHQLYQQDDQIRERLDELEHAIDDQASHAVTKRKDADIGAINMDDSGLESYSDLYSTTNLLTESSADSREITHRLQQRIRLLTDELYQQQRLQRQLSEVVLATRLVPVSTLVPRLERIVRETCRKTGKQAAIEVHGQALQVDSDILKGLTDSLLHMLRNAIDHGIELAEQRVEKGKPESGQITLTFSLQGHHVVLLLEDDGRGIDVDKVRQRAFERGLIREQQQLNEAETLRLILQPGFSTHDEVSEVSGRGVGMDVVYSSVEKMRGTLQLSSEAGKGTQIRIDAPQTLIATHALIVRVGENLLAIPVDMIDQLHYVARSESRMINGQWHIHTEQYRLPVTRLSHIFNWPASPVDITQSHTLIMVSSENQSYALQVDEILPSRDIVIKNLAPWLDHIHSLQGASLLANGAVAPVLDTLRLLHQIESGELTMQDTETRLPELNRSTVLVVDDSLSNRKSLSLMLEKLDYDVVTAVDGLDALQVMNNQTVDLVLTDLEMPRMNGLEMTQAIRIWPEMSYVPILMLTSRSTQKHRRLAEQAGVDAYLTKPVQEVVLEQALNKWLDIKLAAA